jgi:hypothetical protein
MLTSAQSLLSDAEEKLQYLTLEHQTLEASLQEAESQYDAAILKTASQSLEDYRNSRAVTRTLAADLEAKVAAEKERRDQIANSFLATINALDLKIIAISNSISSQTVMVNNIKIESLNTPFSIPTRTSSIPSSPHPLEHRDILSSPVVDSTLRIPGAVAKDCAKAIVIYNGSSNRRVVDEFVFRMDKYARASQSGYVYSDTTSLAMVSPFLGPNFITIFTTAQSASMFYGFESFKIWFTQRTILLDDSSAATKELRVAKQYQSSDLKNRKDVELWAVELKQISDRTPNSSVKNMNFHTSFVESCDSSFRADLDEEFNRKLRDIRADDPANADYATVDWEWLISTARFYERKAALVVAPTRQPSAVVSSLSHQSSIQEAGYAKGKLDQAGKEWCLRNGYCTFCRDHGHSINECTSPNRRPYTPRQTVCASAPSSPLVVIGRPISGENGSRSSNKAVCSSVTFATTTHTKQFRINDSPGSLSDYIERSLPDQSLPVVSTGSELADTKEGGLATVPVNVCGIKEAVTIRGQKPLLAKTSKSSYPKMSNSKIPESWPVVSTGSELADTKEGGLATVPVNVCDIKEAVVTDLNKPMIEDITSSEPRNYWNESPADDSVILERIVPHLSSSAFEKADVEVDTTPMPTFIQPIDRKLFNCKARGVRSQNTLTPNHQATLFLDGGSDGNLMSSDFALKSGFVTYTVPQRSIAGFEGTCIVIDQECKAVIEIANFCKTITFSVSKIGTPEVDIILGVPFYKIIRVINEDWENHKFKFVSRSGTTHTWHGRGNKYRPNNEPLVYMVGMTNVLTASRDQIWSVNLMDLIEKYQFPIDTRDDDGITVNTGSSLQKFIDSELAVSSSFISNISDSSTSIPKTNSQLSTEFLDSLDPEIAGVLRPFLDSVLSDPPKFGDIPCRPEDMEIPLKPDTKIPNPGLRRFSDSENNAIKIKLVELLDRGFIRPSKSEFGANLLFSRKKDGQLRMCIDYRSINQATVKDRTPLPSHVELRESIKGSQYLSKFDIRDAFHMIRISSADCHKTAFKTLWGSYEYTVCPFGLANSPATFMRLMNRVFFDLMGVCLIFYVDDILVYSSTYEQHLIDIEKVMLRLQDHHLHVKISKCVLAAQELEFCGMKVSSEGFAIQQSQIDAMCEYPDLPATALNADACLSSDRRRKAVAKYVQQFLGSVRFFADFIPWIGELALPLYELTSKTCLKDWNVNHQMTIRSIQHALSTAPVLSFFDHSRPETHVYSDASNFAIGGWVSQVDCSGKTHIISYWSRKLIPAETRYTVHEREFLGLHDIIAKFRMYLHGTQFIAHVDHRSMEHLQTQPNLSPRQARWLVYLQEFDFIIEYITGVSNTFADWLSRRPDFIANHCDECHKMLVERLANPTTASIAWVNAAHSTDINISSMSANPLSLKADQLDDPFCQTLDLWERDASLIPTNRIGFFKSFNHNEDGLWMRKNAFVVPHANILSFLEHFHNRVDHGHFGFYKTMSIMEPVVYWESMISDVKLFIKSCSTCQHVKAANHTPFGMLTPLDIPDDRFQSLNIDFAPMPTSFDGFDSMLIIRDRFSKLICTIPTTQTLTASLCAELIYEHWYLTGKGFPLSLVSDRDKLFVSNVWARFCVLTGIERIMSTARHQQTNGGAESAVKAVKQALIGAVNYKKSNWTTLLNSVCFAYNNSIHPATGYSPFYLAYSYQPSHFPIISGKDPISLSLQTHQQDLELAHENLYRARLSMENTYNRRRTTSFTIAEGSLVLLDREGIKFSPDSQRSQKLLQRYIGPFKVTHIDKSKNNVTLELPPHMRCHKTFHISLLREWVAPDLHFPMRKSPHPLTPACNKNGHDEFEAEKILDSRLYGRWKKRQFLIHWRDTDDCENSWEPEEFLTGCADLLEAYMLSLSPDRSYESRGSVVKETSRVRVNALTMSRD